MPLNAECFPVSIIFIGLSVGILKLALWLINLPWRSQNKSATDALIRGWWSFARNMVLRNTRRIILITNCTSKCGVFSRFNHLHRPFKPGAMTFYKFAVTLAKQKLYWPTHQRQMFAKTLYNFVRNTLPRNTGRMVVIFIINWAFKNRVFSHLKATVTVRGV